MSDRHKCNDCGNFVGGGVLHDKGCSNRGEVVKAEELYYKCDDCGTKVGYTEDRDSPKYHSEDCDMFGEIKD
jgi:hypothetical protein